MRIAYVANHGAGGNEDERCIARALRELGHDVTEVYQTGSPAGIRGHDLLLFHHWYNAHLGYLRSLDMPKAGWFFDKVWNGRDRWIREIAPLCTRFFLTDETWARTAGIPQLSVLRQGFGGPRWAGAAPPDGLEGVKLAHVGGLYGERANWAKGLQDRYQGAFRAFQGVHGQALAGLCAKVPVVVVPKYPQDDRYWSNRPYLLLGHGAFLIHPRLAGLEEEYTDGKHLVMYGSDAEMYNAIDRYLGDPDARARIAAAGQRRTISRFTYRHRCRKLLEAITRPESTGTAGSARRKTGTT